MFEDGEIAGGDFAFDEFVVTDENGNEIRI
jgi:hypothetical protein